MKQKQRCRSRARKRSVCQRWSFPKINTVSQLMQWHHFSATCVLPAQQSSWSRCFPGWRVHRGLSAHSACSGLSSHSCWCTGGTTTDYRSNSSHCAINIQMHTQVSYTVSASCKKTLNVLLYTWLQCNYIHCIWRCISSNKVVNTQTHTTH